MWEITKQLIDYWKQSMKSENNYIKKRFRQDKNNFNGFKEEVS